MGTGRANRRRGARAWAIAAIAAAATCATTGTAAAQAPPPKLKTAIVQVAFKNEPNKVLGNVEQAKATLQDGPKSVNSLMEYISGGRLTITGRDHARVESYGPYVIPSQHSATGPCQQNAWIEEATAEAKKAGVDLASYDRVIWGFPKLTSKCEWAGFGGGRNVWQNDNWLDGVLAHELGHTFQWNHAGNYTCTVGGQRVALAAPSSCTRSDGGDPWELMGTGQMRTPSAFRLLQAQFLDADQRQVVTRSGEYTISPMQPLRGQGTKVLRIPRLGKTAIDLEFRQPHGTWDNYDATDPVVSGVTARFIHSDNGPLAIGSGGTTGLIDTKPATEVVSDAPLAAGQTLEDPETGLKITTRSVGPTGAVVAVDLPYTPDVQTPTKPTELKAEALYAAAPGSTTAPVRLTWKPSTDDVGVAGYRVFRGGRDPIATTDGSTTTFTDPGAPKGQWAFYNVEAFDKWGYASGHSAHAAVSPAEPPYAPRVDVSFPGGDKVLLASRTRSDTPLNPTIFDRDGVRLGFNAEHRWEDKGVQPGRTYRYDVKAYTVYGQTGPATTCEVTVPANGSQGSANCTAPAGIPMTPRADAREGGPLGPDEPFFPRAGHAWMGNVEGSPAFWVDGHHIEHWAWTNICPGEHIPNSTVYSNRHIKIDDRGEFRFHGHAMQKFAGGREHETSVLFKGRLGAKHGTVTVMDEHPGCHAEGEGDDAAGSGPISRTYHVHTAMEPVSVDERN